MKDYFENKKHRDMETIRNMKFYTFDEILDEQVGPKGTPRSDKQERKVEEALHAYRIGETHSTCLWTTI